MSSFRIPLVWQMYGHVDVEADMLSMFWNGKINGTSRSSC